MTLDEIARDAGSLPPRQVPEWCQGTVHRRAIMFATGHEDTSTRVVWVQAHTMTGDLRIHPLRPALEPSDRLEDLDLEDLVKLASVEGGTATTSWTDGVMSWSDWIAFQVYDKYPEPGILRRVGTCMIEFAPSGIYVEDWRFQPSEPGLLAGLRLVSEVDASGTEHPRQGGLVIAGDHAVLTLARRHELPEGTRAQDYVRNSADPAAAARQVLDCAVDYAVRKGPAFEVALSTDPRRQTLRLALTDGFSTTGTAGVLEQRISGDAEVRSRLWRVDSLAADVVFPPATAVAPERLAWLEREADTLVHGTTKAPGSPH